MTERNGPVGGERAFSPRADRLVRRFAVRAAVAFLVVGIVIHVLVRSQVHDQHDTFAEFHAVFVVESVLGDELGNLDLTRMSDDAALAEMLAFVDRFVLTGDVIHLKVWSPDGTVVFADQPDIIGERYAVAVPWLDRATEAGLVTQVTTAGEPVEVVSDTIQVLRTYVPVTVGGEELVVEVVQDRAPTVAAAAESNRVLTATLAVGLLGLFALLLPIARRASRRLRVQTVELERRQRELERHLGHEQETVRRLEELGRMKDTLITAVSHELRTPVTVLLGVAQTLARRSDGLDADQRRLLVARLETNATRLRDLLESMLDLDRLERGDVRPELEPVAVRDLTERVVSRLDEDGQVRVVVDGSLVIVADRSHVERIVENLVGNALRHTPDDTAVTVHDLTHDDGVVLAVDDEGPGVPAGIREEIFEPFRQGESLRPHAPGTGVGLALVTRLAEAHGGRAWVEETAQGGASFRVLFPSAPGSRRVRGRSHDATTRIDPPVANAGPDGADRTEEPTPAVGSRS